MFAKDYLAWLDRTVMSQTMDYLEKQSFERLYELPPGSLTKGHQMLYGTQSPVTPNRIEQEYELPPGSIKTESLSEIMSRVGVPWSLGEHLAFDDEMAAERAKYAALQARLDVTMELLHNAREGNRVLEAELQAEITAHDHKIDVLKTMLKDEQRTVASLIRFITLGTIAFTLAAIILPFFRG